MKQYYFKSEDGNEYGPITAKEISDWQAQGRMNSESLVRHSNSRDWMQLSSYPELASDSAHEPTSVDSSKSPPPQEAHEVPPQQAYAQYEEHRGTMILVFGILGIACCFPFGIAAWVMGNADMQKINAGIMDPEGKGTTNAGKICGIISVALAALGIIVQLILFAIGAASQ